MAVALNNHNADVQATSASSLSTSMSVTAGGRNLGIAVRVVACGGTVNAVASASYAAVSLTAADGGAGTLTETNTQNAVMRLYVLAGPATGANTLAVSVTGGTPSTIYADLTSYTGVEPTSPMRASTYAASASGAASAATVAATITSASGDMTTTCATNATGSFGISSTSQTSRSIDNGGLTCYGSDDASGAATVTHTWTFGGSTVGRMIAGFSIQAAPAEPSVLLNPPTGSFGAGGRAF